MREVVVEVYDASDPVTVRLITPSSLQTRDSSSTSHKNPSHRELKVKASRWGLSRWYIDLWQQSLKQDQVWQSAATELLSRTDGGCPMSLFFVRRVSCWFLLSVWSGRLGSLDVNTSEPFLSMSI